jgi:hypothetical protein
MTISTALIILPDALSDALPDILTDFFKLD